METRANYVIVGIFTLIAIVAAFAFVYWASAIGDRGETTTLRVRIARPPRATGFLFRRAQLQSRQLEATTCRACTPGIGPHGIRFALSSAS